jgi:hypothetical protein
VDHYPFFFRDRAQAAATLPAVAPWPAIANMMQAGLARGDTVISTESDSNNSKITV